MRRRTASGFTLIELMIALALTIILIGTMVFIFQGSSAIIVRTQRRIEAFQNVRRLIDLMEEDIGNAVKTVDMEFFADDPAQPSPGHFDAGEELSGADSLRNNNDVFGGVLSAQPTYFKAPVFLENEYTDAQGNTHRSDVLYLRTLSSINGQSRPALVRYQLGDTGSRQPSMRRLKFFQQLGANPGDPPTTDREPDTGEGDVVADGIVEFEIEIFFKENTVSGNGQYLDPSGLFNILSFQAGELVDLEGSPTSVPTGFSPVFEGPGVLEERANGDVVFFASNNSQFPQVRLGDSVFIRPSGNAAGIVAPRNFRIQSLVGELPDRSLPTNFNDPNVRTTMRFEEPIDLTTVPSPDNVDAGFPQHNVEYRVGWMPSSVRVRFRIRDKHAKEEFDIVRVFKILSS